MRFVMEKIKVIVADDHPVYREGLCRLLRDEIDFNVVAMAENGAEAVESARKLQPDVAIMDVSMPKLNGIEAARQIRRDCPGTAILMLSADSYQSLVLAALRAGAVGYLSKNTPVVELIGAIRMARSGGGVFNIKAIRALLRQGASGQLEKRETYQELHPREVQVLTLAAKGIGNKKIGDQLGISERTVQTHLVNIFRKLNVTTRTEAVLHALREGWLTLESLENEEEVAS
jgi:DNA-binding NarL/FixJ family response regulator